MIFSVLNSNFYKADFQPRKYSNNFKGLIEIKDFYNKSADTVLDELNTTREGLDESEVDSRREKFGFNEIVTKSNINPLEIFIGQFKSFIIYILFFAVFFAILIGEYTDSIIILMILLANSVIGFFQEMGAQKSLEALKKMTVIQAKVIRENSIHVVDSKYLVPGDIVFLEAGDKVPADCRIIEASRLKVEESSLTGESIAVNKNVLAIDSKVQIGDQKNMIFSSTTVSDGVCKAVVVKTGMNTEIGKITTLIKEAEDEETPLQKRLNSFGKKTGYVILGMCFLVFLISFIRSFLEVGFSSKAFVEFAFVAISLAVAAVPSSLPAVVTISLSIGVKKLLKRKALVRKLSSVETLGSCDVICTDKTGTLTKNEMTVRYAWTLNSEMELSGLGYNPKGLVKGFDKDNETDVLLFKIGLVCNNADLFYKDGQWGICGDSTEAALIVSARKSKTSANFKKIDEIPFDSSRKIMSYIVSEGTKNYMYTKGAPDKIISKCKYALIDDKKVEMTDKIVKTIMDKNDEYSSGALRVLGFAYREISNNAKEYAEESLIFVGLQAMMDPPREDVIESIKNTKEAGIRVIMITGDYKETARAVGEEIGIVGDVLTGDDLQKMSDEKLIKALEKGTNIFARVMPEHKQRIITCLQKLGHIVAMTGDGVNDAPALKKANIGVAVGSGTEVAKEASDFVLVDDSFSNIVGAIEEGRGIYDNIQKSIMLLLSGNLGEVLILFFAVLLNFNIPLTAILLLWINLVTDSMPALAYSVDKYGKDIMKKGPRPKDESILPLSKLTVIAVLGVVGTIIALVLFHLAGGNSSDNLKYLTAQTVVFCFVVMYEMILTIVIRLDYKVPLFSNLWIWLAVLNGFAMLAVIMYTPLSKIFNVVPLGMNEIRLLLFGGLIFFIASMIYYKVSHILQNRAGKKDINVFRI